MVDYFQVMESNQLPHSDSLILVAVMNNPRDLQIARQLGWYRIPIRSAPKVISVDYLAFYLTSSFGEDKWLVKFIAPVLGHELVNRSDLLRDELDHPHSTLQYFKIQLGNLTELPDPIPAGDWKRITFLYTTGDHFLRATNINDLVVRNEERAVLWRTLRERADAQQAYLGSQPELDITPEILSQILGFTEFD